MDKSPINNRLLRYALLCSVAFHALLLLVFADFLLLTVTNGSQATPVISAQLHKPVQSPESQSASLASADQLLSSIAIDKPAQRQQMVAPVQLAKPSLRPDLELNATIPAANGGSVDTPEVQAVLSRAEAPSPGAPDADDLRTYRLNLSREARRFKRYPAMARERGQEGVVVVVVSARAGIAIPQVSLSQGSGEAVLDRQALEMVSLAVAYAKMPDSLQQRDFGIDLPIHFSLDE